MHHLAIRHSSKIHRKQDLSANATPLTEVTASIDFPLQLVANAVQQLYELILFFTQEGCFYGLILLLWVYQSSTSAALTK